MWVVFLFLLASVQGSVVVYVNSSSIDSDPNTCGTNWTGACNTIAAGVEVACQTTDATLLVAPGVYELTEILNITCPIQISSTNGSNETIISFGSSRIYPLLFQGSEQQASKWNLSLIGFTFSINTSLSSYSLIEVSSIYITGSFHQILLHDLSWQYGRLGSVLVVSGSVTDLRLTDWSIQQFDFSHNIVSVEDADSVQISRWNCNAIDLQAVSRGSGAAISIFANSSIVMENVLWRSFVGDSGSHVRQLSRMTSPSVEMNNITVENTKLSSGFIWESLPSVKTRISISSFSSASSSFDGSMFEVKSLNPSSLDFFATLCTFADTDTDNSWLNMNGVYETLTVSWDQWSSQGGSMGKCLSLPVAGIEQMDVRWNSVSILNCSTDTLLSLSSNDNLTFTGTDVELFGIKPQRSSLGLPLIRLNGQETVLFDTLKVVAMEVPLLSATDVANITILNAWIESTIIEGDMIAILRTHLHARNVTMIDNSFLHGLNATSSEIKMANITLQDQNKILNSVIYTANSKSVFDGMKASGNGGRSSEYKGDGRVLNMYNSSGLIIRSIFQSNTGEGNGGVIAFLIGELNVTDSQFFSNGATRGGAVAIGLGMVRVTNCQFAVNQATYGGAILAYDKAILHVHNSTMYLNQGDTDGGAIWASDSIAVIHTTEFQRCRAPNGRGGALYFASGGLSIDDAQFQYNYGEAGGAIYTENMNSSIANSMFIRNSALNSGGDVHINGNWIDLSANTFENSTSLHGGSLYWQIGSHANVHSCTFRGTNAAQFGGAISVQALSGGAIQYTTFNNCSADSGGAIQSSGATLYIADSTFYGCHSVTGGAIEVSGGTLNMSITRFADNWAQKGGALFLEGHVDEGQDNVTVLIASGCLHDNRADFGGAIFASQDSVTFITEQTILQNNTANSVGGAIYAESQAKITILDSILKENSVEKGGFGGALFMRYRASALVNGTQFLNNIATNGGAVAANSEVSSAAIRMRFYHTKFEKNTAQFFGGALHLSRGVECILENCEGANNEASSGGFLYSTKSSTNGEQNHLLNNTALLDGAAYWLGGTAALNETGSYILSNLALRSGAGVFVSDEAILSLSFCEVKENSAKETGGAIMVSSARSFSTISNTLFAHNNASRGGGLSVDSLQSGEIQFDNCTWLQNHADEFGAAIFINSYIEWIPIMFGAIFDSNYAEYGGCNMACTQVLEKNAHASVFCQDCDFGTPPTNYSGYQTKEQFASWPSALVTSNCSQSIPLDVPYLDIFVSLQDGFGVNVTGPYLVDHMTEVTGVWPYGVTSSAGQVQKVPDTGLVSFPSITLCGNNLQQFILQFSSYTASMPNMTAECAVELNGCSLTHLSPQAGVPCGYCRLDDLILLPLVLLSLLMVTVCMVVCCFLVICTRRYIKRYQLRSMQVPDLSRGGYTLEDLLADSSIVRINWQDVEFGTVLGKGASGLVRQATWKRGPTRQEVATKELLLMEESDVDAEIVMEFCKEIKYMSSLHHPNVVAVVGIIVSPDQANIYLASELMSRGSLHDIITKKGANIPLSLRFRIAIDAAEGMRFIHSKNVIHRDLKSHNLLVNSEWKTKIADFGISTIIPTITRRMTCIGTPLYMAPEVLQQESYSECADVYSFAIVMCELFTNRKPYSHPPYDTMSVAVLTHHITELNVRPSVKELHPTLQNLIEECWTTNPHSRPSFAEVVTRLRRLSSDIGKEDELLDELLDDESAPEGLAPTTVFLNPKELSQSSIQ